MLKSLQLDRLNSRLSSDVLSFRNARPFKHLVFDDLVVPEVKQELVRSFPSDDWFGWKDIDHEHQRKKLACDNQLVIPEPLDRLISELNSGPFISWLEHVTEIEGLTPDPHLEGGGLHMSVPGGWLTPHTDFHVGKNRLLYRRLNLLLYLNENWSEQNNGALELWDKGKDCIARQIPPEAGRCVIFETNDESMHGFSKPLLGRRRCSVALYYYTAAQPNRYSGDGATYWRTHTIETDNSRDWMRLRAQRALLLSARMLSGVSWRLARAAGLLSR
jgi:2OG-Fe(II) oxygenase superfamily